MLSVILLVALAVLFLVVAIKICICTSVGTRIRNGMNIGCNVSVVSFLLHLIRSINLGTSIRSCIYNCVDLLLIRTIACNNMLVSVMI